MMVLGTIAEAILAGVCHEGIVTIVDVEDRWEGQKRARARGGREGSLRDSGGVRARGRDVRLGLHAVGASARGRAKAPK